MTIRHSHKVILLGFFRLVEYVCQMTLATVLSVEMVGHEDTSATAVIRTFTSQTSDLAVFVYFIVLQYGQLDFLLLVFDLLWSSVILLLTFAATTTKTQYQMKS